MLVRLLHLGLSLLLLPLLLLLASLLLILSLPARLLRQQLPPSPMYRRSCSAARSSPLPMREPKA